MNAIAYDVETTGLRLHSGDKMFAWSTCDSEGKCNVFRLGDDAVVFRAQKELLAEFARKWLARVMVPVMHNAKFDLTATENLLGIKLAENIEFHCTYLQSCIVRNNHVSNELKDLAYVYAGIDRSDEIAVKHYIKKMGTDYSGVPETTMAEYQALDAYRAMLLHRFFYPMIEINPQWLEIYHSELYTEVVTMRIEERGVMIRRTACETLIAQLEQQIDDVLVEAAALVGKPVKLAGDELLWLLFTKFKVPVLGRTGKRRQPSTEKEVLLLTKEETGNRFPILDLVLKHRSWTHGVSILRSYLEFADEEGIIHPNINSCRAITARQSCSKPNLHSVSKSRAILSPYPVPSRRVFCPRPGYVNFHIDYSGQELRILIHYSAIYVGKDKIFWDILEEDGDLHYPACKIFYPEYDQMPPEIQKPTRDAIKNTNFAGAYGAQDLKMSKTAGLPFSIGAAKVQMWRQAFPCLSRLSRVMNGMAAGCGYVMTCFGRRLYVRKAHAAVNTVVQGTGAEVLKRGENAAHKYLQDATGGEMRLILPIHDELIIECPRKRLNDAKPIIRELAVRMTDFPQISVPMKVEVKIATFNWEHTEPFEGWE